ncbi:S49 family peptidase [Sagittula sp. S175]|uniref:S49 family peptidase n=1 Tax=Sagittula sp. S175 TaxID=3415129 RepID=UPI003C7AB14A
MAVLRLRGEIALNTPVVTDLYNVLPQVDTETHVALIVTIDTEGGTLATAETLNGWIDRLYRKRGKPVICVIEERCLSAGIAVAVACDRVFAPASAQIGAFGAMLSWPDAMEFRQKFGLAQRNFVSRAYKDIASPNRRPDEGDAAQIEALLRDLDTQFAALVRKARPAMSDGDFETLANSWMLTGRAAHEIGLTDGIGGFDAALELLVEEGWLRAPTAQDLVFLGDPNPGQGQAVPGGQLLSLLEGIGR